MTLLFTRWQRRRAAGILTAKEATVTGELNGRDYYVALGHKRALEYNNQWGGWRWEFARCYGLLSAGGSRWHWSRLENLTQRDRVFAYVVGAGYVGIGKVTDEPRRLREHAVPVNGGEQPLIHQPDFVDRFAACFADRVNSGNDDIDERVVPVKWMSELCEIGDAFWEPGTDLFRSQNTACELTDQSTIDRVMAAFGLGGK